MRGRHDMGTPVNGFGGGRGHQGQDIFAGCGTPVVAARAGKVVEVATEGNEGNYVVMETSDGRQQAYLHLLHPHSVARGDRVDAGSASAAWGRPATPRAATCTSSCGPPRAGSRAVILARSGARPLGERGGLARRVVLRESPWVAWRRRRPARAGPPGALGGAGAAAA